MSKNSLIKKKMIEIELVFQLAIRPCIYLLI